MNKLTGIIKSENKLTGSLGVRNEINVDIIGTGARGKEGKSAYEIWLDLGNEGTEQEYLASLKGNEGYTPIKGVDYFDGIDGKDGKDGYTPIKGIDYFDGEQGEKGEKGYTPIKGIDYFDGKDGYTPVKGVDYFDGEKGDTGERGTDANYVHDQISSAKEWRIIHSLGKYPSVTIVDSGGNVVVGDIKYVSTDEIEISFSFEFSGKAYLN